MTTPQTSAKTLKIEKNHDNSYSDEIAKLLALSAEYDAAKIAFLLRRSDELSSYQVALNNIPQGICVFTADKRLILANRRYSEIYRLDPDGIMPGISLREIAERRVAVGTCPTGVDDLLQINETINSRDGAHTRVVDNGDGRIIQICHQKLPDGGWVATHEDVTEFKAGRAIENQAISLQVLIDWVPDYLWIKDTESRFVVVNKALASDTGHRRTTDIIGLSDFDLHPLETARTFREIERGIILTGEPQYDVEETIVDAKGARKWISSIGLLPDS